MIKRGEIWLVDLDPTVGHEIRKLRPAVIIQNDYGNKFSPITIVAPITSQKIDKIYPFEVLLDNVKGLEKNSKAVLNQIRAVDMQRLIRKLGRLDSDQMVEINSATKISLGL